MTITVATLEIGDVPVNMFLVFLLCSLLSTAGANAEWPMVRQNPQHTGFSDTELALAYRLAWVREFAGERLGTAVEPILHHGKLFVATHAGRVHCLTADKGDPLWSFQAQGPLLHSPAAAGNIVLVGSTDEFLYGLEETTGSVRWALHTGPGGFAAAPVIDNEVVYVGTRQGDFLAVTAKDGRLRWRTRLGVPIRQTAAVTGSQAFVLPEDLHLRCFNTTDGHLAWESKALPGQTARDYYPVIVTNQARSFVIVRTNPLLNMGQRIGRDRMMLCRNAGVDDRTWQTLEAWTRSDQARGDPDLWAKEQTAIIDYLETNPDARNFFVLDARTGQEAFTAPILWIGGCQSVGAPPAQTKENSLLVFYRSAYGNWNLGVAPLVALGRLDLAKGRIEPVFHQQGRQPPWNCFWGTADESQNFTLARDTVLIAHQGTLSRFNCTNQQLTPLWGNRDTYGGFANPPWARNEWHGPARSGVALAYDRIYWQTGSRVLCLAPGTPTDPPPMPVTITNEPHVTTAPTPTRATTNELRQHLNAAVEEVLSRDWAPLFMDPGLAGRFFSFAESADLFDALAWAYPHIAPELQGRAKARLQQEWKTHPPFAQNGRYSLTNGAGREWFDVPTAYRMRLGADRPADPFGSLHVARRFAHRCDAIHLVRESWPALKTAAERFLNSGWQLDPNKGDPYANRYLASLVALGQMAVQEGDDGLATRAQSKMQQTLAALTRWWQRTAAIGTMTTFKGSAQLDPFIGKGDGLFLALAPHRHKVALFADLTPEVARLVQTQATEEATLVWSTFERLCPTWFLVGEERQVHFGENFVDASEFAVGGFRAFAWLKNASEAELARRTDLPIGRADLDYVTKLALVLEASEARERTSTP